MTSPLTRKDGITGVPVLPEGRTAECTCEGIDPREGCERAGCDCPVHQCDRPVAKRCRRCNGELAAAMLEECTPAEIAHAYVHAVSERDNLRRIIERACRRLGGNGRPHPNDVSWARTILREAIDGAEK